MSVTYKILTDISHRGTTSFDIKKGDIITEEELSKKFGKKDVLSYMIACCGFGKHLEVVKFEVPELGIVEDAPELMFLVNEDILKSKKVVFVKGDKKSYSELEEHLTKAVITKYLKSKSLMEIKVQNV